MRQKRRAICLFLALFLLFTMSCRSEFTERDYDSSPPITSLKNIPGITEEEKAEISALLSQRTHFVYGMTPSTEAFYDMNGDIRGFSTLFCQWLTELFGIPFITAIYEWGELSAGLEDHSIDFTGDLTETQERLQSGNFMTGTIAERTVKYMRLADSAPFSEIESSRALKFAFLDGSINRDQVASVSEYVFETVFVEDYETAYELLSSRVIDAFFAEGGVEAVFDKYGDIVTAVFFPLVYVPVSMTTLNPELEVIVNVVCKLLGEHSSSHHLVDLYKMGNEDYLRHSLVMSLTEEERQYIEDNRDRVIPFLARYDNYPLGFYNTHEMEWQGIAFDVLARIETLTGLSFEVYNAPDTEMIELLRMLEYGEAPMITELLHTPERDELFLWPAAYVMTDHFALISKTETPNISFTDIMRERVGLIENAAFSDLFMSWFPDHRFITWYPSVTYAFEALGRDEIDMLMGTENLLLLQTNFHEEPGYKANIVFDRTFESTFAFHGGEAILCSLVDKTLHLIDTQSISAQWSRKTYDYRAVLAQSRLPIVFVGSIALSLLIILFLIYRRNRSEGARLEGLVQKRTAELSIAASEQRRVLNELEQAVKEAEASNKAKSIFLANMSHEIRTPMNSIIGFSELAMGDVITPQTQERLEQIIENSNWLLQLINDILDISKVESGRMDLEHVPFDLGEILTHCQKLTAPKASEKNVFLQFYTEPFIGKKLVGDPTRLRQVIMNILTNAIKFTHIGTVKVSATVTEVTDTDCTVLFEIRDSGIGMTPGQMDKIFKPFAQADSSTTRKYGGTGLGLSITKSIIELMGGKLEVESIPGLGSKFSFRLRFDTVEASVDTDIHIFSVADIEKPMFSGDTTVLVCEDNKMNQRVIEEHLKRVGLQVVIAENGKIGVQKVKERLVSGKKPFDLIFMDIYMPLMDGLEAASAIMRLDVGTPIVALTANVMSNDRELYTGSGMHEFIGKPFTSQELWACLLKYLNPTDDADGSKMDIAETEKAENDLQDMIKRDFYVESRDTFSKIASALEANDIQLAHRLTHTLKSNAAMVGCPGLREIAAEMERLLSDGKNEVEQKHIERLEEEFAAVLRDFAPLCDNADKPVKKEQMLSKAEALELVGKLKPLLIRNNTESLDYINEVRYVEGSETVIEQMESFDFIAAAGTLTELVKKMEE